MYLSVHLPDFMCYCIFCLSLGLLSVPNVQMVPTSYNELCLIVIVVISPPESIVFLFVGALIRLLTNELDVFLSWVLAWFRKKLVVPKCAIADQRWAHHIFFLQSQVKIYFLCTKIHFLCEWGGQTAFYEPFMSLNRTIPWVIDDCLSVHSYILGCMLDLIILTIC